MKSIRIDTHVTERGEITTYELINASGASVKLSSLGAGILEIKVPDRDGRLADVVLGYKELKDYFYDGPCAGKVPGRYANRIAKGHLDIDGTVYQLNINNGPNHLHGGPTGFHARVWDVEYTDRQTLRLKYVSADGEEGFPGNLVMQVTYTWTDANELFIDYEGTTDRKTIVNMTSHGFFSLAGTACPTPSAMLVVCQINADFFVPIDENSVPTGEIRSVKGTPFDFTTPHVVGERIDTPDDEQIRNGAGYDHCFVLNKKQPGEFSFAVKVTEPATGRTMEVFTTEPGVQFYSDNWADGYKGQHGATFPRRSAICFECQHFPDSPNRPYFPSVILHPGEQYKQKTVYRFGVNY